MRTLLLLTLVLLVGAGCNRAPSGSSAATGKPSGPAPADQPYVVAISYPLQAITQAIAGSVIEVEFPCDVPDPVHWRPLRNDVLYMQSADLIFANGTGAAYAKWLPTVSLPEEKLRLTASRGLSLKDFIPVDDVQVVHSHGPEGEHSHATMVSRTWLDPAIAAKQADYIAQQLIATYPGSEATFTANLTLLKTSLAALTDRLAEIKKRDPEPLVITGNYELLFLTRAAGWQDVHLNWEPNTSPDQAQADIVRILAARDEMGRDNPPTLLLVPDTLAWVDTPDFQDQLTRDNIRLVKLDMLDVPRIGNDFVSRLKHNIDSLIAAANSQ